MKLLIVESPGKIKKLQSILGKEWLVSASVGHVRDLPISSIGVSKPEFIPQYQATDRGKEILAKLKGLVAKCDEVYLAMDPDREGEAIAWHLMDALKLKNPKRVTYTSITEKDVLKGISEARTIDMNLVKAQEARRVLDRLCGYMVSPILSNALCEPLSAGRVQSPAVSMVVVREKAIQSFQATTYCAVEAEFSSDNKTWLATWKSDNFLNSGEEYILDNELAKKISEIKNFTVKDFSESENKQAPPPPFTTSTLQQSSSFALGFSPKKTMQIAQKLYEKGHITYMRTDSPNLSEEAISAIFDYCDKEQIERVSKARTWKSKANAQEAHEAIRPTHFEAIEVSDNQEEQKLYELIRNRTIASLLKEAVFKARKAVLVSELDNKEVVFEAQGSTLISKGWKAYYDSQEDSQNEEEAKALPLLEIGSELVADKSVVKTKKTKAPTRYTQASLIKELEKVGIGRPATYASILENIIFTRAYIKEEKGKLFASPLGIKLIDSMQDYFSFLSLDFTKEMEERLDDIAQGKHDYLSEVSKLHTILEEEIKKFQSINAISCPNCKSYNFRHLKGKKNNKPYDFFACSDCKETFNNIDGKPVKYVKKASNE